ncbi:hypothetical protein NMY22_g10323 [Coprinellus aureogranulatus]|nr:hypothetical protein NMY22_g10323 [Coprinellus aureogranulatus]
MPHFSIDAHAIKSTSTENRLADLKGGKKNENIIGYSSNNTASQKFYLSAEGGDTQFKISVYDKESHRNYVHNAAVAYPGATLNAGASATVYSIESINDDYYIYTVDAAGHKLYWTLPTAAEGVNITLEKANNSDNQIWSIKPVA